jgi:hypothetical protein
LVSRSEAKSDHRATLGRRRAGLPGSKHRRLHRSSAVASSAARGSVVDRASSDVLRSPRFRRSAPLSGSFDGSSHARTRRRRRAHSNDGLTAKWSRRACLSVRSCRRGARLILSVSQTEEEKTRISGVGVGCEVSFWIAASCGFAATGSVAAVGRARAFRSSARQWTNTSGFCVRRDHTGRSVTKSNHRGTLGRRRAMALKVEEPWPPSRRRSSHVPSLWVPRSVVPVSTF